MDTSFTDRLQREHAEALATLPAGLIESGQRDTALRRMAAAGLPGRRDEGWRHTDLRPLEKLRLAPAIAAPSAALLDAAAGQLPAPMDGLPRFVFVNGRHVAALSTPPVSPSAADAGLVLRTAASLTSATRDVPPLPDATLDERFTWLNDAFSVDVARLDVRGTQRAEVIFLSLPGDDHACHPRLEVMLAPGAQLQLVERHLGGRGPAALTNAAARLLLGRDARLQHLRLQDCADDAVFLDSLLATVGDGAEYALTQLTLGAGSTRSALRIDLDGDGGSFGLHGLGVAGGRRVQDMAVKVTHRARRTTSRQLLRAIARDRAGIAIASRVDVAATAAGADSQQSLKGLIADPGAEVNLQPQLEISTDAVKASHGATTGALDADMLFYLLSRGLDPATARQLLEWAFLGDVLSHIPVPALRRPLELATLRHLGNTAATEALQ